MQFLLQKELPHGESATLQLFLFANGWKHRVHLHTPMSPNKPLLVAEAEIFALYNKKETGLAEEDCIKLREKIREEIRKYFSDEEVEKFVQESWTSIKPVSGPATWEGDEYGIKFDKHE